MPDEPSGGTGWLHRKLSNNTAKAIMKQIKDQNEEDRDTAYMALGI
jgi:hypothetical protein